MHAEIKAIREAKAPLSAFWSIGGVQCHGNLSWHDDQPVLTLVAEIDIPFGQPIEKLNHPLILAMKAPFQPTIAGRFDGVGLVTLESCMLFDTHESARNQSGPCLFSFTLRPTRIWIGSPLEAVADEVIAISAFDERLYGFFGEPAFKCYRANSKDQSDIFAALGSPSELWAFYEHASPSFPMGETGFTLSISSRPSECFSAREGHTVTTVTCLSIRASKPRQLGDFSDIVGKTERLLSTFSLERHALPICIYYAANGHSVALAWQLGDKARHFEAPMRHQVLFDFSDSNVFGRLVDKWFRASRTMELSRWIFCRALSEADDGVARFIAVAQAFEVLGRELGPSEKISKVDMNRAARAVENALKAENFPSEFVERRVNLIRSSNHASYRTVLEHLLTHAVKSLSLGDNLDLAGLSRVVETTRNDLIHMTDKDKTSLDQAFARVPKLSLQLCFWYAIVQAAHLGVPPNNAAEFLINNRNARHGLPNHIFARD